ncbi:methionine adenosyltransferase 2 subunit beta-like isoform X1 [Zootermopsis nevadensis]|uniref:Methionine adenosyltransferase 2 subunit beta n=1 Tax=Zootermopsis nevadensis TaxID=136037 RepID=A0A067RCF8_ZOONE|nr:methionine adenosyltransferase 2 subunit beta-like isoform X1 [Zootermopsis nevadensis]XP_021923524.1 methionine adenosyltransferase 2 subunit beta-like isoform X1 [Zootermopsis nevadensis]XP_021923525.1 methionine adenosyltransferase 2 subunit beta-like isoform X1 [Zootermopsis nevadensis]KDR17569.1 Methionine adenosyltransferase 2 subunit beta [Zootermopsis nevadensis]
METIHKRLFLTGASGLLGRAVYKRFANEGWTVYGTAYSRVVEGLHKLDLTDDTEVKKSVTKFKPSFLIHCAAQRFPDKVDLDPVGAAKINVDSSRHLAHIADFLQVPMLHISTDYVFDGKSPPYAVNAVPSPLNLYGKTKLNGEKATLAVGKGNLVLRVPVLYGPVEYLAESAVTVLLNNLIHRDKPCKISNYERRCPSHVDDIADICLQLAVKRLEDENICGIFHWCGKEIFTKYDMLVQIASVFHLPYDSHVIPDSNPPSATTTTHRPYDTTLDTSRLEQLGIGHHTPFDIGIKSALQPWVR